MSSLKVNLSASEFVFVGEVAGLPPKDLQNRNSEILGHLNGKRNHTFLWIIVANWKVLCDVKLVVCL